MVSVFVSALTKLWGAMFPTYVLVDKHGHYFGGNTYEPNPRIQPSPFYTKNLNKAIKFRLFRFKAKGALAGIHPAHRQNFKTLKVHSDV